MQISGSRGLAAASAILLATTMLAIGANAAVPSVVASSEAKFAHGSMSVPTKVVIDGNGNLFTQDEGSGTLWGIAAGTTTPVKLLSGMNYQQGVAVDQYNDLIVSSGYNGNAYFVTAATVAAALASGSTFSTKLDLSGASGFSR